MATCKKCRNDIPDNSIFCNWCGVRQASAPRKRTAEKVVKVPAPRQLPSLSWFIQLRLGGVSYPVLAAAADECADEARLIKAKYLAGQLEQRTHTADPTLEAVCKAYIARRSAVLSPSTVNGYETIIKTRFLSSMGNRLSTIDWQRMINEEAKTDVSAKTIKNAWGFVASALREAGVPLPQVIKSDRPWLDYEQLKVFLAAVKGQPCEMAALFALHGLRKSELLALTPSNIVDGKISVAGSVVMGSGNKPVWKETNKNSSSRRTVAVKIPRLTELLEAWSGADDEPYVTCNINTLHGQINAVCQRAGLPAVGVHGLRRSFASLAYHLGWSELETMREGGWSDYQTMHKIYIKLADKDASKAAKKMERFYKGIDTTGNNANKNANAR